MHSFDVNNIFTITNNSSAFDDQCVQNFQYQYTHNLVYKQWCELNNLNPSNVKTSKDILALPISLFKTHPIITTNSLPEFVFESSGTTQTNLSRHWVADPGIYQQSFMRAFQLFYGDIEDWCILGLLPSYLEKKHSSLVMMVDELIKLSGHELSGFYLDDHEKLSHNLQILESRHQKTLLIGVTFGLLEFAKSFPQQLKYTLVMETGGMKGRRKEITRQEVHQLLSERLGVEKVHAEYGMTELLSQAYSKGEGRYICPPWMKVLVRDEEDPMIVKTTGTGILQVIDLANIYSCSFIATEDMGTVYEDGSFEVWGRLDNSDMRGCSLLVV